MTTVSESTQAPGQLAATLQAGVEHISGNQTITFTKYVKVVLPLDGYVFWVKASLLSKSALFNAAQFNSVALNQAPRVITPAATFSAKGSLHYATDNRQEQDKNSSVDYMIFTSEREIVDLNETGPYIAYFGEFEGQRFSFSQRQKFYKQAGLWHYRGDAIYPVMETQIIDRMDGIDLNNVIVSNSLPIWLALNQFAPVYPSYLVDQNLRPPFVAVHIEPGMTEGIAMAPLFNRRDDQSQLVREPVKFTAWGFRNFSIMDYLRYLCDDSLARPDVWGLMNIPIPQDEKMTQKEQSVIAQKKTFTLDVNYYQSRVRDVARQLILSAFISFNPSGA